MLCQAFLFISGQYYNSCPNNTTSYISINKRFRIILQPGYNAVKLNPPIPTLRKDLNFIFNKK